MEAIILLIGTTVKMMDPHPLVRAPALVPAPAPAQDLTHMARDPRPPQNTGLWSAANTWPVKLLSGWTVLEILSVEAE